MTALGVVMAVFEQSLAHALRDAAVYLAVDDQRVDRAADVVDRGIIDNLCHPGFGIDFDFTDVAAIGEAREQDSLVARRGERSLQILRQVGPLHRRAGDFE